MFGLSSPFSIWISRWNWDDSINDKGATRVNGWALYFSPDGITWSETPDQEYIPGEEDTRSHTLSCTDPNIFAVSMVDELIFARIAAVNRIGIGEPTTIRARCTLFPDAPLGQLTVSGIGGKELTYAWPNLDETWNGLYGAQLLGFMLRVNDTGSRKFSCTTMFDSQSKLLWLVI